MSRQNGSRHASELDAEIGFRIRQIRQNKKIAQAYVAEECGISRQQLRKYELGRNRLSIKILMQISETLKVDIGNIINPDNNKTLPAIRDYSLQRADHAAASLWEKIDCPRKRRAIIELMDILHQKPQPLDTQKRD